jgi:hypothetical protein
MKIIFLDIDGVLNCENGFKDGFCNYRTMNVGSDEKDHYQQFYPPSKKLINKLIEETNAKIVISSIWRHSGIEFMKRVWESEKMSGEIIDVTPSLRNSNIKYTIPRGCEIDFWLDNTGFHRINWSKEEQLKYVEKSGVDNYIIIDDDSDMLYKQKEHFVHVLPSPRNKEGFNEEYYNKALNILNKNIVDLYYEKG